MWPAIAAVKTNGSFESQLAKWWDAVLVESFGSTEISSGVLPTGSIFFYFYTQRGGEKKKPSCDAHVTLLFLGVNRQMYHAFTG